MVVNNIMLEKLKKVIEKRIRLYVKWLNRCDDEDRERQYKRTLASLEEFLDELTNKPVDSARLKCHCACWGVKED